MATATGLTYLARYTGQVIGVASSSSLLQSVLLASLRRRISGPGSEEVSSQKAEELVRSLSFSLELGQIIDRIRHVSTSIPELPESLQGQARGAYHDALRAVFLLNAGMALLCWISMTGLREFPLPATFAEEQKQQRARTGEDREQDDEAT